MPDLSFFDRAHRRFAVLACLLLASTGCRPDPGVDPKALDAPVFVDLAELASENSADLRRSTTFLDLGTDAARPYLLPGFSDDTTGDVDGDGPGGTIDFVWALGTHAELAFQVAVADDLPLTLRGAPALWRGGPDQRVTVRVNGRRVGQWQMRPGLREYSLRIPGGALRVGDNILSLDFAWAKAPRDVGGAASDDRSLAALWDWIAFGDGAPRDARGLEVENGTLVLAPDVEAVFSLWLPAEGWLTFDRLSASRSGDRLRVRLAAEQADSGGNVAIAISVVEVRAGGARSFEVPKLDGSGPVLLEIGFALTPAERGTRHGSGQADPGRNLRIEGATVRLDVPPGGSAIPGSSPERGDLLAGKTRPPLILVYVIDTLRADHLGMYGYEAYDAPISPHLDALAADGFVFDQVAAQSSWTRSASASLFTGLWAHRHGVHGRDHRLGDGATTFVEALSAAGYATAGWTANGNVSQVFDFDQGFDLFELVEGEYAGDPAAAGRIQGLATTWLAGRDPRAQPVFLYVHTMEPHAPYWPEAPSAAALSVDMPREIVDPATRAVLQELIEQNVKGRTSKDLRRGSVSWVNALTQGLLPADAARVRRAIELYDAEIRTVDRHFGALVGWLKQEGLYDEALVVVVADHGEEFGDHGGFNHGRTLYEEQLRVPLLLKPPKSWGARTGRRIEALVRQIDVAPTLLSAAGTSLPGADGASLWPMVFGVDPFDGGRPGVAHLDFDGIELRSVRIGEYKLICPGVAAAVGAKEAGCRLFDLAADPGETIDLVERRPILARHLRSVLRRYHGDGNEEPAARRLLLDDETDAQLRALGYH